MKKKENRSIGFQKGTVKRVKFVLKHLYTPDKRFYNYVLESLYERLNLDEKILKSQGILED